jgi:uncharacterized cupredoxin-like copper-binding protein
MQRTMLAATVVASALAVAACGSSSNKTSSSASSSPAPAQTQTQPTSTAAAAGSVVSIQADPSGALKFTQTTATAKAGTVTFKFSNPAPVSHGLSIKGQGIDKDGKVVQQGGTSTLSVSLKPGKYTFYCPVPGHLQAGMQGTLTVQ